MPSRRIAAFALATLLAGACSDDDGGGADDGPVLGERTPTPTTVAESPTTAAEPGAQATVIELEVEGGNVNGVDGRITVDVGSPVVIRVQADTVDQVHVHGYDLTADVAPDQPAVIEFTADLEGVWEVELEDAQVRLFELEVS